MRAVLVPLFVVALALARVPVGAPSETLLGDAENAHSASGVDSGGKTAVTAVRANDVNSETVIPATHSSGQRFSGTVLCAGEQVIAPPLHVRNYIQVKTLDSRPPPRLL